MNKEIQNNYKSKFLVLLTEEYGYRHWFWFPDMSPKELEDWWMELESVEPYFMTPEPLPGVLFHAQDDDFDLFLELKKTLNYYTAHIHCDDDSVLRKADKTIIYHKGYEED